MALTRMSTSLPRRPSDDALAQRFRACLLGGAVGDALGAAVEFDSMATIQRKFGPAGIRDMVAHLWPCGSVTDDTQMTLFTAEALLRGAVRSTLRGIPADFGAMTALSYAGWLRTQGEDAPVLADRREDLGWLLTLPALHARRAPGNTCLGALRLLRELGDRARNDSKGCGGVMRVAPIGLFAHWMVDTAAGREPVGPRWAFDVAVDAARVTHGHASGYLAAGAFARIVYRLLQGMPLREAVRDALHRLSNEPGHEETSQALREALALANDGPARPDKLVRLGEGWVAEEALAMGVYCALAAGTFEEGVVLAVNHGGDSDSTGSIAGNLLGLLHGPDAIPARWLAPLELREVLEAVADDLAAVREWDLAEDDDRAFYWSRYPGG